jgi:hypothetical protein
VLRTPVLAERAQGRTNQAFGAAFLLGGEAGLATSRGIDAMPGKEHNLNRRVCGFLFLVLAVDGGDHSAHEVSFHAERCEQLQLALSGVPGEVIVLRDHVLVPLDDTWLGWFGEE